MTSRAVIWPRLGAIVSGGALLAGCGTTSPDAPPITASIVARAHGQHVTAAQLNTGRNLFVRRCIECHSLPAINEHAAEAWPAIVRRMSARAGLTSSEREALLAYILAAHRAYTAHFDRGRGTILALFLRAMNRETVDALLTGMLESGEGVSDLLFVPGKPPLVEIHGHLHDFPIDTPGSVLSPALIEQIAGHVINGSERLRNEFAATGSCDCSYAIENLARFRVNVFKQNGRHSVVMRKLESEVPSLDKLQLPPVFREIIKEKNGIVFVTGGTGTGKTTTLAAMINELNRTEDIHILTLEDPIEFFHPHGKAAISQRELGNDFPNFADGLRAALRQAPKVILVGEIRDRATLEIAMAASETGHVVYSTLHTVNAGQTILRILGMYSREDELQVRQRLSETLRYVISQRLVPKVGGGRLLVTEVMGSSLRTRETITYGESENKTFEEIIEAGSTLGWHSFDQSLVRAFEEGLVSEETVIMYCTNKTKMRRTLDTILKARGVGIKDAVSGLKMHTPDAEVTMPQATPPPMPRVITPRPK